MELEYSKSSGGTKSAALPVSPICIDFQVGRGNSCSCFRRTIQTTSSLAARQGQCTRLPGTNEKTNVMIWKGNDTFLGMEPRVGSRISSEVTMLQLPGDFFCNGGVHLPPFSAGFRKKFLEPSHHFQTFDPSVSCHDSSGGIDFSDLFLSSSMDWTVKLWSARWNCVKYI